MSTELTKKQIEILFDYVHRMGIHYIDLKHELVDHLATAIEDEMSKDSNISFNTSLWKVYRLYPYMFYNEFARSKQKELSRYWRRQVWGTLKQYLKSPKILIVFMLLTLFGSLAIIQPILPVWLLCIITSLGFGYQLTLRYKNSKHDELYLVLDKFNSANMWLFFGSYQITFQLWYIDNSLLTFLFNNNIGFYSIITLCTFSTVLMYSFLFESRKIIKEELKEKYPHLDIALT